MSKKIIGLFVGFILCLTINAQQATIVTWNSLNFSTSASSTARIPYFQTVLDSLKPDILVVQELAGTEGANYYHNAILENTMAMAPFIDGYNSDNALFYNAELFTAIAQIPIETELRNISQYVMVHLESGDTLRVFSVHLKASSGSTNQARRLDEVTSLREVTNAFSSDTYYLVCGDFNIYSANEPAYQLLTESQGGAGYFDDPLAPMPGTWNNTEYAAYHTQSPRLRGFGGGASSGMDDRFDMILFSPNFSTNEDIAYVENSTWAVGNDGNHYNDSVNKMPNTMIGMEMADALHFAADHLPVMAKIEFFNNSLAVSELNENAIQVYPNPSNGKLNIEMPSSLEGKIVVRNNLGCIVHMTSFVRGATQIDLSHLSPAIYFIELETKKEKKVVKLVLF